MKNREIKYYPTISQWVLGGIICLLLVAGLCYLWYNHSIAPYKQEAADTAEEVRQWEENQKQWEENQKAGADNVTKDKTSTPAESTTQTSEKPITETISTETEDITVGAPKNVLAEIQHSENTDAATVSPYGFGPYPEIPEGYPLKASWLYMEEHKEKFNDDFWRIQELMSRVLIKLYNQGDTRFTGASVHNGLVLPQYSNVAYVYLKEDQTEEWTEGGDILEIDSKFSRILGDISEEDKEKIRNGEKPPGIEIRSFSDGINPYTFLGLQ